MTFTLCAEMATSAKWTALPSVIIVEILSYLPQEDRLKVTAISRRWRSCLFHPNLWKSIQFDLRKSQRQRSNFLAVKCGGFVREAVVKFDSECFVEVKECNRILNILSENRNLRSLSLVPTSCRIQWEDNDPVHIIDKYLDSIESLIKRSRKLQHLSLGCVEELLDHSVSVLNLLAKYHSNSIESLHLASLKEDADNYGIIELDARELEPFTSLKVLSIDYDHLSNDLLEVFCSNFRSKLEKIHIHVHGVEEHHEIVRNETWRKLRVYNPDLEVTLSLVQSVDGVSGLLDILKPCMPLVHFRQFCCSQLNIASINFMSTMYNSTLKTFQVMDTMDMGCPNTYSSDTDEDPFVMLAWRCLKLEHFSLIGYEVADDDVIAIARLRGEKLKTFQIPRCCISSIEEEEDAAWLNLGSVGEDFSNKVSNSLKRNWLPIEDDGFPVYVLDENEGIETAYIDILLQDQRHVKSD